MALKAGERGVTKRLFSKLKRLPPIKTIGSGLSLSAAGVLKATITPTDVGLVAVKTMTYTGNGSTAANGFELDLDEDETLLCVLGIDDISTETADYYNHINTFYPVSWARTGYTGTNALTTQSSAYKTYSGRALNMDGLIQLAGTMDPVEMCNVEGHIYEVTYMTYKVTTPSAKKAAKK